MSLDELRREHLVAWERDARLGDWPNEASSRYVLALEAEVDRLRALVGEPLLTR